MHDLHVFLWQCLTLFSLITTHFRFSTFFQDFFKSWLPYDICFPPNILYKLLLLPNRLSALLMWVFSVSCWCNDHIIYSDNTYSPNVWVSVMMPASESCDFGHFSRKFPEKRKLFLTYWIVVKIKIEQDKP